MAQYEDSIDQLLKLKSMVEQGQRLGLELSDVAEKIDSAIRNARAGKTRIVMLGSFSDGKTSAVAGMLGSLHESMKIDVEESSDELTVYHLDSLGRDYEIVDTPGLFGTKEKEVDGLRVKCSEMTQKYISEAEVVIYVCDAVLPLKDSHRESLRLVLRDFGKLPVTIFAINKMDEAGTDMTDEDDYNEHAAVKRATLTQRLNDTLALDEKELAGLRIVCIAADPKARGPEYWLKRKEDYERRSHISLLRHEVEQLVGQTTAAELAEGSGMAVVRDVLAGIGDNIDVANRQMADPLLRCRGEIADMRSECTILRQELNSSRSIMTDRLNDLKQRVMSEIRHAETAEQLVQVVEEQIGMERGKVTCYILNRNISQIMSECAEANNASLERKEIEFESRFTAQNDVLGNGLRESHRVLREVKSKLDVVSHAYNLFSQTFGKTAGRAVKPGTKAGRWIGNAGVALSVAMELYDWYEAKQRNERVAELQHTLRESVNEIFSGIFRMFDSDESYFATFAPSYPEMLRLISTREEELQQMQRQSDSLGSYRDRIRQWVEHDIIDAETIP
ncbi:MAG: LeoA/HP0731 family dynamin-like GTPase [Prevotella sp.]|uniref:LeoA/HP0731 family dynamin-like GTPase n=1 Tax=Prevotella sp. TaxID=59823 RepID=UPI002A2A55E6|nr:LeoA/HP0731 family dynamin-like GTPase [Prevotella sp.]MDD7317766.1 dynamin family protein [Prevotellaceae bacterium]MDY4020681.1 LeoA/HP0731 family dynamin-like GTPase [Prevotella sp.]